MRELRVVLVALGALASAAGCMSPGATGGKVPAVIGIGLDAATSWDLLGAAGEAGDFNMGVDLSWSRGLDHHGTGFTSGPALGACVFRGDAGDLSIAYVSTSEYSWQYIKPMIGIWSWSESPEGAGLFTGLKFGAIVPLVSERDPEPGAGWSFEYGRLWLNDAYGEKDSRLTTWRIAMLWPF